MTNRAILQTPKVLLREVDRQRQFLLRVESTASLRAWRATDVRRRNWAAFVRS